MIQKVKSSLSLKFSLVTFLLLVFLAAVIVVISLFFYQRDVLESYARNAQAIAETISATIDGDRYEALTLSLEEDDYLRELKSHFDSIKTQTDSMYLYGLNNAGDGEIMYVVEGMKPGDDPSIIMSLGAIADPGTFAEETFTALRTGQSMSSEVYDADEFGTMVSGLSPVRNSSGKVVGIVGADISLQTVMSSVWAFSARIIIPAAIISVLCGLLVIQFTGKTIGKPIQMLAGASAQIAVGSMNVNMAPSNRTDEIGELSAAFLGMVDGTKQQVDILEHIAHGDYTQTVTLRSPDDSINSAIQMILKNNIRLISDIHQTSRQVAAASMQIANSAQSLAAGSTQQAASLEQLSAAAEQVLSQANGNAKLADETSQSANQAGTLMNSSTNYMLQMTQAMAAIESGSQEIAKVIKVIDDIAFQTNILALNAAVEAARAGQHGKGFAVVADEVRNLASKSAEAARETAALIAGNVENVKAGGNVADKTSESLLQVSEISSGNVDKMTALKDDSIAQSQAIVEITDNIGNISAVVQANTATAEQSAAAAEEMSAQAALLEQIVSKFVLPQPQQGSARSSGMSL